MSEKDKILEEVVQMLTEVVGEDFLLDLDITMDTTFNEDLALESIEFVALAEKFQQRYGGRIDFAAFLSEMEIDEIMGMTVGTLVSYIEERTTAMRSGG
jgi:acyl carrier protein